MRLSPTVWSVVVGISLALPAQAQDRPVDLARVRAEKLVMSDDEDTIHKIVGGKVAPPGKFPFQVALIWSGTALNKEYFGQFCGGTLIALNWVLTAAHCLPRTDATEVDVYVGAQELPRQAPATGDRVHSARVLRHNFYSAQTKDNDIALIKLANPPAALTPAAFATADVAKTVGLVGGNLTVIGWGATATSAHGSSELREVDVTVQDSTLCQQNYQQDFPGMKVSANMFCAGQVKGGKDSCRGDSGGFIGAPRGAGWVSMGIVSFGDGCAKPGRFGIYTRVANYLDWITKTIKAN